MKLNGFLMSQDNTIAQIIDGELTTVHETILPLYLRTYPDIESWLEGRAIDGTRANARLLKKALGLSGLDDASMVLGVNAATITDTYWIRDNQNSNLSYNDVVFRKINFINWRCMAIPTALTMAMPPRPSSPTSGVLKSAGG
jgi:hypothetical protein